MTMPALSRRPGEREDDRVLNVFQVAVIMDRSPYTIRQWFREGKIPGAKRLPDGRWIILESALEAFLRD